MATQACSSLWAQQGRLFEPLSGRRVHYGVVSRALATSRYAQQLRARRTLGHVFERAESSLSAASTSPVAATAITGSSSTSSACGSVAKPGEEVAVVIVDHGSRRAESNAMLHEFVELFRRTTGRQVVEPAHMELAEPSIEQAVSRCVERGAKRVIVAPYFLSRGRHIQDDIPALVAAAQQQYPNVECVIAEPIGIDSLMAQLIEQRVLAAAAAAERAN